MSKVMGKTQIGRTGLGYVKRRFNDEKQQNHQEFLEEIRKAESESLPTKAVQEAVQGQWSKWQGYVKRDMSWHNLLKSTPWLVLLCLETTCNTLAAPQNHVCCEFEDDIECAVCKKKKQAFPIY